MLFYSSLFYTLQMFSQQVQTHPCTSCPNGRSCVRMEGHTAWIVMTIHKVPMTGRFSWFLELPMPKNSCPRSHRYLAPSECPKQSSKSRSFFGPNHETSWDHLCSYMLLLCFQNPELVHVFHPAHQSELGLERRPTLAPQSSDLGRWQYTEATRNGGREAWNRLE